MSVKVHRCTTRTPLDTRSGSYEREDTESELVQQIGLASVNALFVDMESREQSEGSEIGY